MKSPSAPSRITRIRFTPAIPGTPPGSSAAWRAPCSAPAPPRGRAPPAPPAPAPAGPGRRRSRCQRRGVARRDAPAGAAGLHRLHRAAVVGRDHRAAHRLRLDHHAAERLGLDGGVDDDIGEHEGGRHVVAVADDAQIDAPAPRRLLQFAGEGFVLGGLAHQHADRVAPGQRLDEDRLALPAREPPGQHDHRPPPRQPPLPRQRAHPFRRDRSSVEQRRIDAAMDHPDALGGDPVAAFQQVRDEAADRDHPLAARHYRVVLALAREIAVGAVIGRHEAHPGAPRRQPGGPGGRTGAGVHDPHPLGADQRLQPRRVAPDRPRVLAVERQHDVLPAGPLDQLGQAAAGARHQRAAPRLRDRLRHLQRAALHTAAAERRQDLQHGNFPNRDRCVHRRRYITPRTGKGPPRHGRNDRPA